MKSIGTTVRALICQLTDAEMAAKGSELAQAVQDRASEENRQVSLKAEMKASLVGIEARVSRLALIIARRAEYRDVKVNKTLLDDGTVRETREDTGEVLVLRPIKEGERQLSMAPESVADVAVKINTEDL